MPRRFHSNGKTFIPTKNSFLNDDLKIYFIWRKQHSEKSNIISNIFLFDTYISKKYEIKKIEKYFEYCNDNTKKIKQLKNIKNPKISIISPIYNREKFISRFIESIYNQNFQDIEIIFVDDNSNDNGVNLIEKYKKRDKRIILIKNKKNRGTFVTRNLGVLSSKAKYVIIPDPDDILSRDIITICYKYGEKYQYDFIRFYSYKGNGKFTNNNFCKFQKNKAIYQPELSTYIYYGNFNLQIIDSFINNKFIKKTVYIKALNALNNFYLNIYMVFMEDSLMNYLLYRNAKSLYFIKNIGYRYKKSSESITKRSFTMPQTKLKSFFIYFIFLFEFTKNTKYEKDMLNLILSNMIKFLNVESKLLANNLKEDYYFYYHVINNIINCIYISNKNKNLLNKCKKIIINKLKLPSIYIFKFYLHLLIYVKT